MKDRNYDTRFKAQHLFMTFHYKDKVEGFLNTEQKKSLSKYTKEMLSHENNSGKLLGI
jgi:hypothetical protein